MKLQKGLNLGNNEACAKFAEFCTLNPSIVFEITTYNLCHYIINYNAFYVIKILTYVFIQ